MSRDDKEVELLYDSNNDSTKSRVAGPCAIHVATTMNDYIAYDLIEDVARKLVDGKSKEAWQLCVKYLDEHDAPQAYAREAWEQRKGKSNYREYPSNKREG